MQELSIGQVAERAGLRTSTIREINSVRLSCSVGGAPRTQHLYLDNLVVAGARPR